MRQFIEDMKPAAVKKLLDDLLDALDEYAQDDAMGTEGWRHALGMESRIPENY